MTMHLPRMKRFLARVALLMGGTIAVTHTPIEPRSGAAAGDPPAARTKTDGGADAIRPFRVHFSDEELADLKRRVSATRWPDREIVTDSSQGVQLATVRSSRAIGRPNTTGASARRG